MGFFADGVLPDGKNQLRPVPATADPSKYVKHTEWNALCAGVKDLRTNMHVGTTKGDLLVFDGTTYQRLPVGSNGQVLTADSTIATVGVKWAAGGGGSTTLTAGYAAGSTQTDSTILLDSTRKGVLIRDNATPLATTNGGLFAVQDSSGTTNFIQVDQRGLRVANTATTGTTPRLIFGAPAAHTALTAAQELNNFLINGNTFQWTGGGSWTQQRFHVFNASTIDFTSSTTIPTAATLAILNAPTAGVNATLTNSYALWVQAGLSSFDGNVKTASIGPSATQQHTLPAVASDTVGLLAATQTLTNKTLTAPVLGGTITGTYTLGGTPTIPGFGYIGQSDQLGLGATSTTSTTFANIGNGSSTGYAQWTTPSLPFTKTYLLFVNVAAYATVVAGAQTVLYQILVDGSAPGGQPANAMRQPLEVAEGVAPTSFMVPLSLTAGTHTIDIQWKVSGAGNTMNVNSNCTLQYVLWG